MSEPFTPEQEARIRKIIHETLTISVGNRLVREDVKVPGVEGQNLPASLATEGLPNDKRPTRLAEVSINHDD